MRLFPTFVLLTLLASTAPAAELTVASDPPLPVANLVPNPQLEEGERDAPAEWWFSTARPDLFETGWVDGGRSGKCVWMKTPSAEMSGYWHSNVPVVPGKRHLFKGWYRIAAGKILCYAHARVKLPDGRQRAVDHRFFAGTMRGHWLVPVFLPPDSLGGPDPEQWYPFRFEGAVGEEFEQLAFSLGAYFQATEVSFDDLWAGVARTDLSVGARAADGEALGRVVVRAEGVAAPLFDSKPLPAETRTFETTLADQSTDGVYTVELTLADGTVVTRRYPD